MTPVKGRADREGSKERKGKFSRETHKEIRAEVINGQTLKLVLDIFQYVVVPFALGSLTRPADARLERIGHSVDPRFET